MIYMIYIYIAAKSFGIPCDRIIIHETSTDTVANSQPSAASMSTDLYGMATLDACEQILKRLAPVAARLRKQDGEPPAFDDVVKAAYFDRIDLSAHGFYIVPDQNCGYDWTQSVDHQSSAAFNYFTTGQAFFSSLIRSSRSIDDVSIDTSSML